MMFTAVVAEEKHETPVLDRYAALDGIRVVASFCIVLMHVKANGNFQISGFVYSEIIGGFGELVFLFMIISAFSMCCGYYERLLEGRVSIVDFYKKRFEKIWPFFTLLCCIEFLTAPGLETLYETFADATLMFGLLPNHNIEVIGVGWFLGLVFVFYLLFPFFCFLMSDKRRAWCSLIVGVVLHYLCLVRFTDADRTNIVYCAMFFLAGGIVFLYRERLSYVASRFCRTALAACLVLTAGLYAGRYFIGHSNYFSFYMLVLYTSYLIYAIGHRGGVFCGRVVRFFSRISLEIYLCHMVVFRILEKMGMTRILGEGIISYIFVSAATIGGAVIFSIAAKRGFQKLVKQYKRRH